jgi:hypothetical protein
MAQQDGIKITVETKQAGNQEKEINDIYLTENLMSVSDKNYKVVYNAGNESLTTIDDSKKEYMVISKAELMQLMNQMKQMVALMQGQLNNLPPQQRAMFEKLMGDNSNGPVIKYEKKRSLTVNGWQADEYSVSEDEKEVGLIALSQYEELGTNQSYFVPMKSFINFFHESFSGFAQSFQLTNSIGFMNLTTTGTALFDSAVPVKFTTIKNGKVQAESEMTGFSEIAGLEKQFEIPKGYKKQSLDQMMQSSINGK